MTTIHKPEEFPISPEDVARFIEDNPEGIEVTFGNRCGTCLLSQVRSLQLKKAEIDLQVRSSDFSVNDGDFPRPVNLWVCPPWASCLVMLFDRETKDLLSGNLRVTQEKLRGIFKKVFGVTPDEHLRIPSDLSNNP